MMVTIMVTFCATDGPPRFGRMRDLEVIDSKLRLLAAVRRVCREQDGILPSIGSVDELLDERSELVTRSSLEADRCRCCAPPLTVRIGLNTERQPVSVLCAYRFRARRPQTQRTLPDCEAATRVGPVPAGLHGNDGGELNH
jgi:hypothetical protein